MRKIDAVVIGASAGGVETLNRIFSPLQAPLPVPVLVVLHITPQGSILLNAFGSMGKTMKLKEAEDKEPLEAGVVYFAPPNYHLLVESDRSVSLSVEEAVHFARPSVDVLFESALDGFGSNLLGVLLTGANDDGAEGLQKIHEAGGVTVVQEPSSAQAEAMPRAALELFEPSYVLDPEGIARLMGGLAAPSRPETAVEP